MWILGLRGVKQSPFGNGLLSLFNTGLTNLRVVEKKWKRMTSKCRYLFLCQKKGSKRLLNNMHTVSLALSTVHLI